MCIRSKHDAITAWCATVKKVRSNQTPLPTQRHNQSRHSEASAFTLKPRLTASTISISVYRCIAFCLLIATHNSTLITGVSSVEIAQQNMVVNSHGINDFSTHSTPLFKHPYRRRFKRAAIQRPERHLWSPDLVTFVCDELADPCTRAAFLRRHAFHEICSDVPPLYLLPHIADAIEGSNQSSTRLCVSTDKGIRNTDGLFRNYLETPSKCRKSMEALDAKIRSSVTTDLDMFVDILERSFCTLGNDTKGGVLDDCAQCQHMLGTPETVVTQLPLA
ncbi:unnamed protein product [Mesocestoides corti]|uniref:Uncharacterized protein n=2 Tax=Mesocestoides corti TaxID=53468 RepID=A0A0R3UHC7_MESCO|nr:unnamed protein product [Mesocestoides corti]